MSGADAVVVRGVGVHSGAPCEVTLRRATGVVRFRRGRETVEAHLRSVVATPRCTVLGHRGARVAMVEHLLAALALRGFWRDVLVESSAEELPILDGSAAPWLAAVEALGAPPPAPAALRPAAPLRSAAAGGEVRLAPCAAAQSPQLCVEIDYPHPAVGRQRWCGDPADPRRADELLDARTFGFAHELEALRAAGLGRGATLENAIVFGDDGPLRPLRHPDEPVRHKALDAIGDLFLLGRPLAARVRVVRGSHALHVAFMKELCSSSSPGQPA